ncbi:MAG: PHP domain-containing protein [Syntrophomonadaceae bacterium]
MYEYIGNIHIHSAYSDGTWNIKDIARAAKKAGLDFIIITDHFNLDGLRHKDYGYSDGVLVMVGMEINSRHNHYLALNIREVIENNDDNPQLVIDEVNAQGGIGIIAHPFETGSPYYENGKTYKWKDWSVKGIQGIEVWNHLSCWRDGLTGILRGLYLLFNPARALIGPNRESIKMLDRFHKMGYRVFAFGGSDAHGRILPFPLKISSYEFYFRCINLHIITEQKRRFEFNPDQEEIYKSLRNGNFWVANDYYHSSKGFRFEIESRKGTWIMGNTVIFEPDMIMAVRTPVYCEVKVYKDGVQWTRKRGTDHRFSVIKPGVYRVEALLLARFTPRTWIITNPIWVV